MERIPQGPLPEDYIAKLAKKCGEFARNRCYVVGASEDAASPSTSSVAGAVVRATKSRVSPSQVYFGHALTQAYHDMLMSGLEYGYLASGEVLTFLRIPKDDYTALLYHVVLFPTPRTSAGATTDADADQHTADDTTFRQLAISQLCSLCLLADEARDQPHPARLGGGGGVGASSPDRPIVFEMGHPALRGHNAALQPPLMVSDDHSMSTSKASSESAKSSLGKRRRLGNDDGDDSDNDNGSGGGEPRGKLTSRTHQPRAPSPLQHHESSVPYEEETKGQGCAGAAPPPTRPRNRRLPRAERAAGAGDPRLPGADQAGYGVPHGAGIRSGRCASTLTTHTW